MKLASDTLARMLLARVESAVMAAWLADIARHDRRQASDGIVLAAERVAEIGRANGLDEVEVVHFPVPEGAAWWTFQAPMSWTPLVGHLRLRVGDQILVEGNYPDHPFLLATHSSDRAETGLAVSFHSATRSVADHGGRLVLVSAEEFARRDPAAELAAGGAVAFAACAVAPSRGLSESVRGRIELPAGEGLCAFSLTAEEMSWLSGHDERDLTADLRVETHARAPMPIVTATLSPPGVGGDSAEIWICAHLCHLPGANDNASGIVAALAVGRLLASLRRDEAQWYPATRLRFIFGPEFTGTAAFLHRWLADGGRPPRAVINLDMVGEDQALCHSPFVIERPPAHLRTLLTPLAECMVDSVFRLTDGGDWQSREFAGFSDHLLYVDPAVGAPAVQLCHPEDRFNHTDADTLDKVCPAELGRSVAIAAGLALALGNMTERGNDIAGWIRDWSRLYDDRFSNDPLDRIERDALFQMARSGCIAECRSPRVGGQDSPRYWRRWTGPFNARAMIRDLPVGWRTRLSGAIRRNKMTLAMLNRLALLIGEGVSRDEIALGLAQYEPNGDRSLSANDLLDALESSGWISSTER